MDSWQVSSDDIGEVQRDLDRLANEMPAVAARALNTAMPGVKTDMANIIREDYNYKDRAIKKRISITKANRNAIRGLVQSKGGPFHLTDIAGTSQTKKGVKVSVRKDTGKLLIPRTFLARSTKAGNKKMVMRRPGNPRGQYATLWNLVPGRDKRVPSSYPGYGYGPKGSGGKPGSDARIDVFYAPHPEILYNAAHNWAKLSDSAKDRLDKSIAKAVDDEFRKQQGQWG